jgi:hypothetical protein
MATKRQQTMAKITRERAVKEKRERKLEKKRAASAEKKARAAGTWVEDVEGDGDDSAALLDPHQTDGDDGAVLGERVVPGL